MKAFVAILLVSVVICACVRTTTSSCLGTTLSLLKAKGKGKGKNLSKEKNVKNLGEGSKASTKKRKGKKEKEAKVTKDGKATLKPKKKKKSAEKKEKKEKKGKKVKKASAPPAVLPKIGQFFEMINPVLGPVASIVVLKMDMGKSLNKDWLIRIGRVLFVAYAIATQLLAMFLKRQINALDDQSEVVIKSPFGAMGAAASGAAGQQDSEKTTAKEYDLKQVDAIFTNLFTEMLSAAYMHFYAKSQKPLFLVPITGVCSRLASPLVQTHVFRRELKRPYETGIEKMMAKFMPNAAGGAGVEAVSASNDAVSVEDVTESIDFVSKDNALKAKAMAASEIEEEEEEEIMEELEDDAVTAVIEDSEEEAEDIDVHEEAYEDQDEDEDDVIDLEDEDDSTNDFDDDDDVEYDDDEIDFDDDEDDAFD